MFGHLKEELMYERQKHITDKPIKYVTQSRYRRWNWLSYEMALNERVGFLNKTILSFAENAIQTKLR